MTNLSSPAWQFRLNFSGMPGTFLKHPSTEQFPTHCLPLWMNCRANPSLLVRARMP